MRNILHMHSLVDDVPSNASTVGFPTIESQARISRWPICLNRSMTLSKFTSWRLVARNRGTLINLLDLGQVSLRKSLLNRFVLVHILSGRARVKKKLNVTLDDIQMQSACLEKYGISSEAPSNCKTETYNSIQGGNRNYGFASFLSFHVG